MTRINCIPVTELNDKMLLAEYRELPRISKLADKYYTDITIGYSRGPLPYAYTLGRGHCTFFYDKGAYLKDRFEREIVPELQRRGFKLTYTSYRPHPAGLNNNWQPTDEAISINRARIQDRLSV